MCKTMNELEKVVAEYRSMSTLLDEITATVEDLKREIIGYLDSNNKITETGSNFTVKVSTCERRTVDTKKLEAAEIPESVVTTPVNTQASSIPTRKKYSIQFLSCNLQSMGNLQIATNLQSPINKKLRYRYTDDKHVINVYFADVETESLLKLADRLHKKYPADITLTIDKIDSINYVQQIIADTVQLVIDDNDLHL